VLKRFVTSLFFILHVWREKKALPPFHPSPFSRRRTSLKIENISFFFFLSKQKTGRDKIKSRVLFLMDWKVLLACRGVVDSKEIKNRNPNNIWKTKKPKSNGSE
jgi:hypothetical protein